MASTEFSPRAHDNGNRIGLSPKGKLIALALVVGSGVALYLGLNTEVDVSRSLNSQEPQQMQTEDFGWFNATETVDPASRDLILTVTPEIDNPQLQDLPHPQD